MIANGAMRLFLLAWLLSGLTGCVNIDVNGYRAKGGSTGTYKCVGACK